MRGCEGGKVVGVRMRVRHNEDVEDVKVQQGRWEGVRENMQV